MRFTLIILFLSLTLILSAVPVEEAIVTQVAANWHQLKTNQRTAPALEPILLDQRVWLCTIEDGGYVLVAGDDAAYPVLAWSETGTFDPENNPAAQNWLAAIGRQMDTIADRRISNDEMRPLWDALLEGDDTYSSIDRDVEPLITSRWHQRWPYNAHCPEDDDGYNGHVLVGCCATAAVQLMRFWQHPVNGVGSHSYEHGQYGTIAADFSEATYIWSEMPDTLSDYNEEVAEICFHAGVAMDMNYGVGGSGASFEAVYYAFSTHFSYNPAAQLLPRHSYDEDVWDTMIREELDEGRPIYYFGTEEDGTGHAFIIDGYNDPDHFHVNWGWGGNCDGYFYFSNLVGGSHDFTYQQEAFFDLFPVEANGLEPPTGLEAEVVNDNDVQLTWTPPVNDEGEWFSYVDEMSMIQFAGPERAILFDDAVFSFSYPATIQQVQHAFYDHVQNPWGDNDQFIVKIYDADFETVLYESSTQTALRYPTLTTHTLETPLTVYDDFYVTIRALDEVTFCPSSTSGECTGLSHSWWGEGDTWEQIDSEWMTSVNIVEEATGQRHSLSRNRMFLGYNVQRNGTVINPLWLVEPEYLDENLPAGDYTYTVTAVYDDGESNPSNAEFVQIGLHAGDDAVAAFDCSLNVYPNPFNPSTRVSFSLDRTTDVSLAIYNVRGQLVRTLLSRKMEAGEHSVEWHGDDISGKSLGSGVYFLSMNADRYVSVKKMLLLK